MGRLHGCRKAWRGKHDSEVKVDLPQRSEVTTVNWKFIQICFNFRLKIQKNATFLSYILREIQICNDFYDYGKANPNVELGQLWLKNRVLHFKTCLVSCDFFIQNYNLIMVKFVSITNKWIKGIANSLCSFFFFFWDSCLLKTNNIHWKHRLALGWRYKLMVIAELSRL